MLLRFPENSTIFLSYLCCWWCLFFFFFPIYFKGDTYITITNRHFECKTINKFLSENKDEFLQFLNKKFTWYLLIAKQLIIFLRQMTKHNYRPNICSHNFHVFLRRTKRVRILQCTDSIKRWRISRCWLSSRTDSCQMWMCKLTVWWGTLYRWYM